MWRTLWNNIFVDTVRMWNQVEESQRVMRECEVRYDNTCLFIEVCARCKKACKILENNMSLLTKNEIVRTFLPPSL